MTGWTVRRALAAAVAAPLLLATTGCGPDFTDLPLPGKGVSGDTMTVTATFDEALNLADGATVKVNGITVGKVQDVTTEDFKAEVELKIQTEAKLHEGATARLRYTTPLGELFVDIMNPVQGKLMKDGAHMTTAVTDTAPTVEDALASASLLINGGGLAQLGSLTDELNSALGGHEAALRSTFGKINYFLQQANASTAQIDRTLTALDDVSVMLGKRKQTINRAVTEFRPAIRVLRDNREAFVSLLAQITRLTGTANGVARQSKTQLLSVIRELEPILNEVNNLRSRFSTGLQGLVKIARALDKVVPGDYIQLNLIVPLEAVELGGQGSGLPPTTPIPHIPLPPLPIPDLPLLGGLNLDLPGLNLLRPQAGDTTTTQTPLAQLLAGAR